MRLRDIRNIKRPYEAQEDLLYAQGSKLRKMVEKVPDDVILAYQNINSTDGAWRAWSAQTIADYEAIKKEAMHYSDICDSKLGQAKEYTMSFHFQILLCAVLIVVTLLSMMRG